MFQPSKLLFATPGIPLSTQPRDTENGIRQVKKLGLGAMELEFVQSVFISKEKAPEIKKAVDETGVALTCHAPYFINLNAVEPQKRGASRSRILQSAKILDACGGYSVCFHPGYYLGMEPKKVFESVKSEMEKIMGEVKSLGLNVWIRPETTGKPTQFGSIDELCDLSAGLDHVLPVVDFSHLHARTNGKFNTREEFTQVMELIEKKLGKVALHNMHIHLSGIEYGPKGEKNHLVLDESDMNWRELLQVLHDFNAKGVLVCESPNIEEDTLMLQREYGKL
ncbi:MAG: TIM barrel protein [Candidatus Diapherotrites archaeon]|uniref:TIM barrel protein n=1 Tax=Candidatus Iainarchaeum sp. TaxID=3101447 RepID=A0A8T3YIM8_9ARCH|nr:TIM barrel protein [Candidatus Diapherotrites archaeon]